MRRYTPGCETARLRNFGMTIGIRDTRKIDAVYNLTEADVREQGRFEDSIGIYPESSMDTASWSCRRPGATCRCHTGRCCRRRFTT